MPSKSLYDPLYTPLYTWNNNITIQYIFFNCQNYEAVLGGAVRDAQISTIRSFEFPVVFSVSLITVIYIVILRKVDVAKGMAL